MAGQVTKKQHYAPKFYFKRFASDNFLQTLDLKNGKIMKPQPYAGVCYSQFYYAVETGKEDDLSQEFEAFFKSIEDKFSLEFESIIQTILAYQQLASEQLNILALFFTSLWARSPHMRENSNHMTEDAIKWFMEVSASHPSFIESAKKNLEEEGIGYTDEVLKDTVKTLQSKDYEISLDNSGHLQLIADCEEYYRWFVAKNWRFYLAKGTKRFMTSDTPVVDIFTGKTMVERMYQNHIMQRQQFLALTPEILVELTDPRFGKKVKRKVVSDDEVEKYNLIRVQQSADYAYAQDRNDLEDMVAYYLGSPHPI
jgi:hypothetical protein